MLEPSKMPEPSKTNLKKHDLSMDQHGQTRTNIKKARKPSGQLEPA
jgi:hypothetical protein